MSQGKFCFRVVLPLEPGRVVSGESRWVAAWTIREGRVAACRCEGVGASVPREGRCEGVGASVPREGRGTSLGLWPAQPTRGGCSVCVLGPAQGEPDSLLACVLTDCTFVMEKRANPPSQHTGSSDPGSRAATGQAADKTCRGRPAQGACQARCGGQVCPARCGGQAARPGGWCVQLAHTARAPVPPPGKPAGTDSQGPLSVQTDTHSPAERPQPSPATRERAPCSHTCAGVEPGVHVSQEAAGLWGSGWRRPQNG